MLRGRESGGLKIPSPGGSDPPWPAFQLVPQTRRLSRFVDSSVDSERTQMPIVHIERPVEIDRSSFEIFTPPPVGSEPQPTLGTVEAYASPGGTVETGTWEATPGSFARAI